MSTSISFGRTINALLVFTVLFPFVPTLLPGTDTQPLFLLIFTASLALGLALPGIGATAYHLSLSAATAIVGALAALLVWLLLAHMAQGVTTIPARLISFLQFAAATAWACLSRYQWREKTLLRALFAYVLFTGVYFVSSGAIEDTLIRSRAETAGILFASGRGARTLAPEPSFFALQIFNVFILASVLRLQQSLRGVRRLAWLVVIAVCLISSFSAYGLLLLPVVALALYPKTTVLAGIVIVTGWQLFQSQLSQLEAVRAVQVVLTLVESGGSLTRLMLLDASFSGRIGSFLEYVRSFTEHLILGDGFSVYQGGGFISIIAAFGVVALIFILGLLLKVAFAGYGLPVTLAIAVWFTLNLISGPVGVPILGVITGRLLSARRPRVPVSAPAAGPDLIGVAPAGGRL